MVNAFLITVLYIQYVCLFWLKLQLHQCTHKGCNYACPTKTGLNSHMLKHAEPDAFACEICGKTFKRQTYVSHSVINLTDLMVIR